MYLTIYLSIYLSFRLSIYVSIYLCIYIQGSSPMEEDKDEDVSSLNLESLRLKHIQVKCPQ